MAIASEMLNSDNTLQYGRGKKKIALSFVLSL